MRLPRSRPRLTVRRLMVAVAIAGFGLGVERAWTLRATYQGRARFHESRASVLEVMRDRGELLSSRPADPDRYEVEKGQFVRRFAASIAYHEAMRRKYEAAVRHPWLRVEPDPPEPEGPRRGRGRSLGSGR